MNRPLPKMWSAALLVVFALSLAAPATAQTPVASPAATPVAVEREWRITDIRNIEIDGQPLVLSPDGRWLAGIGSDGGSVCVWDVESLTPICAGRGLRISPIPMMPWMDWAPDSSAVAFVDGVAQLGETHNVMMFDIASGALANITNAASGGNDPLYLGTAWTADSQHIVVARTVDSASSLVTLDRDGSETRTVPLPEWDADYLILWPAFVAADDTVIFRVDRADDAEQLEGVWRIGLDGSNPTQLLANDNPARIETPVPVDVSADGHHVSVISFSALRRNDIANAFHVVDTQSAAVIPLEINGSRHILGPPAFSPTSELALLQGGESPSTLLHVLNLETGELAPLAGGGNGPHVGWFQKPPTWAENGTVFIPTEEGGVLLALAHDA